MEQEHVAQVEYGVGHLQCVLVSCYCSSMCRYAVNDSDVLASLLTVTVFWYILCRCVVLQNYDLTKMPIRPYHQKV